MCDVAADRPAVADGRVADHRRGIGKCRRGSAEIGRRSQFRMRGERADAHMVSLPRDTAQLRDATDVDHGRWRGEAQFQKRHEAVAAGQQLRVGMRGHELLSLSDGAGAVVVEVGCIHGYAFFFWPAELVMARHTRSGVSGIWIDSTPSGCSASMTAL